MPSITTLIPTYKRPRLLSKAIESVLTQTFADFILIVCDNCSQDETFAVVEAFMKVDKRIVYHAHSSNIGMMKNYEFALNQVLTPYFHVLSDDDTVAPLFYERAMQAFKMHRDIAFYAGSARIVNSENELLREPNAGWPKEGYWPAKKGAFKMIGKYPVPSTTLFCKAALQTTEPDYSNTLHWDCDLLLQLSLKHPFYLSKEYSGDFVSQATSFSKTPPFETILSSFEKMIHRIEKLSNLSQNDKRDLLFSLKEDFRLQFKSLLFTYMSQRDFTSLKCALHTLKSYYAKELQIFHILAFLGKMFPFACLAIQTLRTLKRKIKSLHLKRSL